jgi:uncharacterized membrane protein
MNMDIIQPALDYVSFGIGMVAILIVVYGVIMGLFEYILAEARYFRIHRAGSVDFQNIRHDIGFHLLLGLEFLIAADITRTIIRPSLEELAVLGGIVAIRTLLSYFLGREVSQTTNGKFTKMGKS